LAVVTGCAITIFKKEAMLKIRNAVTAVWNFLFMGLIFHYRSEK
jgi:hypothetical protein